MTERLIPPLNLFSTPTGSICVVFEPLFSFNLATSEYPLLWVKGTTDVTGKKHLENEIYMN